MKTKTIVAASLILAILFGLLAAVDAQESQPIWGLVTVNNADVRSGPDFAYSIITRLPLNTSVTVLGRAGDFFYRWDGRQWLQIQYGGGEAAWIYARLLRTSVPFNSIPPSGRILPRDNNGRVPEVFDLSDSICDRWEGLGGFTLTGNFMAGDTELTVTYPLLQGANVYSVIVISPSGFRTAFDSETTTAIIDINDLPYEGGVYTWRVAPYWTNSVSRFQWQQLCLLETGGTFDKPEEKRESGTPTPFPPSPFG